MLVAIAGSQGSGKTVIINKLKEKGYETVERKTSRSILADWNVSLNEVNNNPELTLKFQEEILKRKLNDESQAVAESKSGLIVTERTFIDLATYSLVALGKDNEHNDWLNQYITECGQCNQTYDLVFYLKAGHFSIENDGVRGANVHYSRMVDVVMYDLMQQHTMPGRLVVIDTPILEQRVSLITNFINAYAAREKGYKI